MEVKIKWLGLLLLAVLVLLLLAVFLAGDSEETARELRRAYLLEVEVLERLEQTLRRLDGPQPPASSELSEKLRAISDKYRREDLKSLISDQRLRVIGAEVAIRDARP